MADKAKRIFGKEFNKSLVSPRAIAAYAHIRKPDTQGQYADNKHKITLKLAKGDEAVEKFVKDLRAACEVARKAQQEAWKKKKLEAFDPVKDGDEKDDAEEKGWAGFWLVTAKTKKKPNVYDAKKKIIPATVDVFSGDEVKVLIGTSPFEKPVQSKGGISLYLNGVQLLAKNSNGYNAADAFDEEDGFETEEGAEGFGDETGSEKEADGDDNGDY